MNASVGENVTSWFCGVIVAEIFDGIPCFLVLEYHKDPELRDPSSDWKFPGGCNKKTETPLDTLLGEIREEIFPRVNGEVSRRNVEYDSAELVHTRDMEDRSNPGGVHRQFYYLVSGLKGPFREEPLRDDDGTRMSAPIFRPLAALRTNGPTGLYHGHRKAVPGALEYLAAQSREWWQSLNSFL